MVREAVRMFAGWLELHQIDNVDHAYLKLRQVLANQFDRGERFERGHIAAAGHHYIRLAALVVGSPFPNTQTCRAMLDRLVHREELRSWLLARDHDVDIVAAVQTVV